MEAAGAVARQPPPAAQQPPGLSPLAVADVLPPKRQAVVDRLRRRIESYRRRQIDCMPRFDQSFSGLCEQNLQDTLALKQRFLETKAKRTPKAKDKKQNDAASGNPGANQQGATATAALQSSVHVQQKFVKRPADDLDTGPGGADSFEPPMKVQCTTQQHQSHQQNEVHKFSVEIVQQLEFTTSAANSQPQQISTNVTVKALTNASVKSDVSSPKSNPSTPASTMRPNSGIGCVDIGTLVECKQEPDNEFADLDQCAAALEKDAAANGGNSFAGISVLIGDDSNDEFITPDELKTLISEISDYPEFMKNFDFEDKSVVANNSVTDSLSGNVNGLKTEDTKDLPHNQNQTSSMNDPVKNTQSPLLQQQNAQYSPPVFDNQSMNKNPSRMGYSNMDFGKTELSPAAQTLKQMAEQHQNKHQMGLSFNPNNRTPNARSPYTDFTFQQGDYVGSPNSNSSNVNYHKQSPGFPQPDMIKQEMIFQGQNDFDMQKRKAAANAGMYKQQYSPYGSPSASGHGSPGYLPRGGASGGSGGPTGGAFSGGTPPRPPSGPGGQQQATLQINQAQQLHINQSSHGHAIQVSAGQHLHLSGELKGNVSVAAQQGMFFSQSQQQQSQQQGQQQQQQPGNHQQGVPGGGPVPGQQQPQQQQQQSQQGGAPQHQPGGPQMNPQQQAHQQTQDSYTLSQSQTINFTQQTLKQRANGPAGGGQPNMTPNMAPNMSTMSSGVGSGIGVGVGVGNINVGPRHTLEQQQKMMQQQQQQQQMLRAQQAAAAAMQQQQQQMGMARPPPPDYKTSAGMMHGMQPRYPAVPPNMRRMPHQPMPPSGIPQSPMMRPHNMYMMSQQHIPRGMYPRQQAPMQTAAPDSMPQHGSAEWRHLLMTQQQSASFSAQMRPSFQHQGYNVGGGGNMQMTALQHQQMRTQGMVAGNMGQNPMGQAQGAMGQAGQMGSQLNMGSPLSQQMMSHTQQQNMLQQNAAQMSMGGMHMSQTQSMSITNQSLHQTQLNNQQLVNNQNNNQSNALSNFGQTADFSLEFLESLPSADTSNFTDQELLNSFDADAGFNLQDIL